MRSSELRLSSVSPEISAFGNHCLAYFRLILDWFLPNFVLKYEDSENIKIDCQAEGNYLNMQSTFDLIVFNNEKFIDYVKEIYASELNVKKANRSCDKVDFTWT